MSGKRLLVIEDDIDCLHAVSELLRQAGYQVLAAETGREGLKLLHGGASIDLVLLDFWLPDMTGHAFLATRTRWPGALNLPVILVTGDDAWVDEHRDLRQLGVAALLRKPFEPEQLLRAVEQAIAPASLSAPALVPGSDGNSAAFAHNRAEPVTSSGPGPIRQGRRLSDLLVRASELLAQSVDVTAQLRDVSRLVVPSLADLCLIERADGAGAEHRLLCAQQANPLHARELRALAERGEGLLHAVTEVIERGEPQLHEQVTDSVLAKLAHSQVDAQALRRLGFDSVVIVPMVARRRVFGAMTWASFGSQRRYGRAHLETATDLAHRIALAMDNEQLVRSAQEALRAREELLALLSHDLRTPLSTIAATAAKVLHNASSPVDVDAATTILRNARRMERNIRDLLDSAQLEAGSLRVELRKERLSELLRGVVEANRALANKQRLVLEFDAAAREVDVACDPERIKQVLNILIANAIRVTPANGRVSVQLCQVEGELQVRVSDGGRGLSAAETAGLFDRSRREAVTSDSSQNVGLSLSIARGLVEAHGGSMWVQSEPGQGSVLAFTLGPSAHPPETRADDDSRLILLVDDDVAFRRELQEILIERGYAVETADNGWQAWSYLQVNAPPALILLDLMMPVMDGWELHAAIKSHPILSAVPTVILSCLDRYRIEPSLADAQGYIEKPIRTAQLFDIVQRHVSRPVLPRPYSAQVEPNA
jgi:signal transduction histidine kinase/CheY-like chemotaxis protein